MSDSHLGVPDRASSLEREKLLVRWLDDIRHDAAEIYLLGDIFDFWFEYATVVPKGFVRLLGKLAELSDSGIRIHFFTGNHDMWVFRYLSGETGMEVYRKPVFREIGGKRFMIGHGDGLGAADHGYKLIKKIFSGRLCRWLFARIHPNLGVRIALFFSRRSRVARGDTDEIYRGAANERLLVYAQEFLKDEQVDYFVFGHRHLPFDVSIGGHSRYINLGDWVTHFTYAVFDGRDIRLKFYVQKEGKRIITESH
jgi:UDP-2,3-diacylglucosamine hydrolase